MTAHIEENSVFHIDPTYLGDDKLRADDFLLARILGNSAQCEKQSQRLELKTRAQLLEDITTRYTDLLAQIKSINLQVPWPYPFLLKTLSDETLKRLAQSAQSHGMVLQADTYLEAIRNPDEKDFLLNQYHQSQLASLKQTLNYLMHEFTHHTPFIYYILMSVLHYNVITTAEWVYALSKRSPTSRKDFEVVDAGTAQIVYDAITENAPQHPLIINHEAHQCNDLVTPEHRQEILNTYMAEKRPLGMWLKFPQGSDEKVINDFYLMCRDSRKYGLANWCSGTPGKSIAKRFLEQGDCRRFVDNEWITQLGIRYEGIASIAEPPRGMLPSQEIAPAYYSEVDYFLSTHPGWTKYLKHTTFAKLYEQYKDLTDFSSLPTEDLLKIALHINAGDGSYNRERNEEKRALFKNILLANKEAIRILLGRHHDVDPTTIAFDESEVNDLTTIYVWSTLATTHYDHLKIISWGVSLLGEGTFSAPLLTIIEWFFQTGSASEIITPLLTTVEGDLDAGKAITFVAPQLTSVSGDLIVWNTTDFLAPQLTTVGCYLFARHVTHFSAPKLTSVGGDLHAPEVVSFFAPLLSHVSGDFLVPKVKIRDTPLLNS